MLRACLNRASALVWDRRGATAVIFALSIPAVVGVMAFSVEYSVAINNRTKMQAAADAAALAGASELNLAQNGASNPAIAARNYAQAMLAESTRGLSFDVAATVIDNNTSVQVLISTSYRPFMGRLVGQDAMGLRVEAVARISAAYPICALGLDEAAPGTIHL